jgi:hypothetical protein
VTPQSTAFRYLGYEFDPAHRLLTCSYALGTRRFREEVRFGEGGDWKAPGVEEAARLVFLLAGVSYYKTAAPSVVDLGDVAISAAERAFLATFYRQGLAEFAYRNQVDLTELSIVGSDAPGARSPSARPGSGALVPFGGGIDSIVTLEAVRQRVPGAAAFVVSRPGAPFSAIEAPLAVAGGPVLRAERTIDAQLLASSQLGFLNGHVPVTGILSAIAVMAAVLHGRRDVVMSNEWSASIGTTTPSGIVNHQWSKSEEFEKAFAKLVAANVGPVRYFSYLRGSSELWVAERFSALARYHSSFHSCNRAFAADPARRLDHWCGICDKCCFIDLILSPFMSAGDLDAIFDGHEPLTNPALEDQFRALIGVGDQKPFECVGDIEECRVAARSAAARPERASNALLASLAGESLGATSLEALLRPLGPTSIPDEYASQDQLV